MSFLETVRRAKGYLEEQGRVSRAALKREFALDDEALDDLVAELVDVQQVAARQGKVLAWMGAAVSVEPTASQAAPPASIEPQGERRQLTVLFCDLVDSTRLAAGMDAEDWREVVRGYQQAAGEVVERFGGHVAQYLGDGLLVYFGWPRAHEDDVERAVRAGLGIVDAVGALDSELSVRIGIHTGPVVVGEIGQGERKETLALGDTTNVAARILGEAEPDTVLLSDATLGLVRGIFVTEQVGRRTLKGAPAPLLLHRAVQPAGVRSRLDLGRSTWTPFVGREQELGLLIDRWEQAAEGEGQTVFVSGEAGFGKSRLALALRDRVADQPHIWLECRASPYTTGSVFHPVTQLVLQGIRIRPSDEPGSKLRNLEAGIRDAGLDTESVVPLMADLLDIPLGDAYPPLHFSVELQRERTLDAFVEWALALGRIQPLLLLVEDLHWCDPSSLELFGRLVTQIPTSPVLVLMTARHEFDAPWRTPASWTPVVLGRLRKRAAHELVRQVAGEAELPLEALQQILDRGDGVPLYLEELTRAVLESREAGAALSIPATLQDSLMARLDRFGQAKEVAQFGAVLGREFPYGLLADVSELNESTLRHSLDRLVEADLLFQRGSAPESVYTFKHALVQEAAYDSLLRSRRRELHRKTAVVLGDASHGNATAAPELIALHCEKGGLAEEAARNYLLAGQSAAARSAHEEAIADVEHCLSLLEQIENEADRAALELTAQTTLGASLQFTEGFTSEAARAAYERAQRLCDRVEDPDRLLVALYGLTAVQQTTGRLDESTRSAQTICRQAETTGRSLDRIAGHQLLGASLYSCGKFAGAAVSLATALDAYEPGDAKALVKTFGQDLGMVARAYAAQNLWCLGRPDAAAFEAQRALEETRALDHPFTLAFISAFCAAVFGMRREAERCEECAVEAAELSDTYGFPLWSGVGRLIQGWAHAGREGSVGEVQAGMATAGATGNQALVPFIVGILAEVCHAEGRYDEAASSADLGLTVATATGQHLWDAELLRRKAEASVRRAGVADSGAQEILMRSLDIARSQEARSFELRTATSLARLWRDQGKRTEAREILEPVYDWFREGFDTQDLVDAKALLGELS